MSALRIDRLETWCNLVPGLSVCAPDALSQYKSLGFDAATPESTRAALATEGYFQLEPQDWSLPLGQMAEAVGSLRRAGLSTAFAFMYDAFWLAFAQLDPILRHNLGDGYQLLPAFWCWHIDPSSDEAGWTPHRDRGRMALRPDGTPKALTIWLPLTEATPLNGCMYLVPADRDLTYNTENEDNPRFAYPDIRALPAKPGAVLCWNQAVLHWGSHSAKRPVPPRVSMAFEFQRGDEPPLHQMLIPPLTLPNFRDRLILTCVQILQYQHMYPLAPEVEAMVKGVLSGNIAG
jgi:hypothetical protein